jgi:hypothetical protein
MQWTFMMNAGLDPEAALIELRESLPDLPPRLCCALLSTEAGKENAPGRSVTLENLREGMVLHDNILSDDGALLLRKGRRLTLPVIEKLRSHGATPGGIREIVIVDTSAKLVEV